MDRYFSSDVNGASSSFIFSCNTFLSAATSKILPLLCICLFYCQTNGLAPNYEVHWKLYSVLSLKYFSLCCDTKYILTNYFIFLSQRSNSSNSFIGG